jgi:hypothetical protein
MTSGVQQHDIAIRCWLYFSPRRTKPEGLGFRLTEIVDRKIKVHLLGDIPMGPSWRVIVSNLHGGQPDTICLHCNEPFA